jgi:hypothetical protein
MNGTSRINATTTVADDEERRRNDVVLELLVVRTRELLRIHYYEQD